MISLNYSNNLKYFHIIVHPIDAMGAWPAAGYNQPAVHRPRR